MPDSEPPALANDELRRLRCLIKGESIVFTVNVSCSVDIGELKKAIQSERRLGVLKDIDPHMLELWKVDNIDLETHDKRALSRLTLEDLEGAEELTPWKSVLQYWSAQPSTTHLHIIVEAPSTEPPRLGKRSRVDAGGNDLSTLQDQQTKRYRTGLNPSTVCNDANSMQSRQKYAEILNGRPWTSSGPAVGLYHPIFNSFREYFDEPDPKYKTASSADPDDLTPSADDAFSFMRASSAFYEVEKSGQVDERPPTGRAEAVLPNFECLLGVSLPHVKNSDGTEPDARAMATTLDGRYATMAIVELKLESGVGGDAKTQAQQSYARICSLPEHEPVRLRCCSPCFLIEIAGPWITVFGAVYMQKVIVQCLAGPTYLPPQLLHPQSTIDEPLRLFYALRRALQDLRRYYDALSPTKPPSRLFPFVRSYYLPDRGTVTFNYVATLSPDGSRAIYVAEQEDGRKVVVKFPKTYNALAHRLLAEHGFAPELIYDGTGGPFYGGLPMIIMDYVEGKTLNETLYTPLLLQGRLDAIITSVTTAVELLHANDFVFGDLRTPNILVDDKCQVKLIDYDWCGVHEVDRYPFIIGNAIEWAKGVGPLAMMHKDHDLHMLMSLFDNIRKGAQPGYW